MFLEWRNLRCIKYSVIKLHITGYDYTSVIIRLQIITMLGTYYICYEVIKFIGILIPGG